MNTIIESFTFTKKVSRLWSEKEQSAFFTFIANNPLAGNVIPGTGGVRKVRWGKQGSGKRGGTRIVYYNKSENEIWLLMIYAKNEIEDMSAADLRKLRVDIDD